MAVREPKDLLTMLADRGEEAIQRLSDAPGADRLLGAAQALRDRMDEMQKRIRGIDALEKRVAKLEKRLNEMSGTKSAPKRTGSTAKKTSAQKTTTGTSSSAKAGGGSPG
jgi:TolA-binding protein